MRLFIAVDFNDEILDMLEELSAAAASAGPLGLTDCRGKSSPDARLSR